MRIRPNDKLIVGMFLLIAAVVLAPAEVFAAEKLNSGEWKWDFKHEGNIEGWTIPEHFNGRVQGGALWISMTTKTFSWLYAVKDGKNDQHYTIDSPKGLGIPAEKVNKVKLRLLNLSPETDGYVQCSTTDELGKEAETRKYFPMKPYHNQWQEVICHIDGKCKGTIDQIRIALGLLTHKGDIWVDWIAVTDDPARPPLSRPDLKSDKVVPKITIPGITQEEFQDAFNVMDECLEIDVPYLGFEYPFLGIYPGTGWWQLDTNGSLGGAKWANQEFAENQIRGFIGLQAQNADGRIDHAGHVPVRGGCYHLSSLPHYFETAYDIASRSNDSELRQAIYESMRKYHQWWFTPMVKLDPRTGLVTGWFEETVSYWKFGSMPAYTIAPVDTNIAVALGSDRIAKLAQQLGHKEESRKYRRIFEQHVHAINQYLWDEEDGVYYPYNVKTQQREPQLFSSIFNAFRLRIARPEQIERLIGKLLDPDLFNWGGKAFLNSAAQTQPFFTDSATSCGTAQYGMVWSLNNMPVIDGLVDIGRYDLAGELAWNTVKVFNGQYDEFISPITGKALGARHYCWTAAAYIEAIIEYLFGIDYDRAEGRLRVFPHIPEELADETISIKNLILPTGSQTRLNLTVRPDKKSSRLLIELEIEGDLVDGMNIEVLQPQSDTQTLPKAVNLPEGVPFELVKMPNCKNVKGLEAVAGVRIPMRQTLTVRFGP